MILTFSPDQRASLNRLIADERAAQDGPWRVPPPGYAPVDLVKILQREINSNSGLTDMRPAGKELA